MGHPSNGVTGNTICTLPGSAISGGGGFSIGARKKSDSKSFYEVLK